MRFCTDAKVAGVISAAGKSSWTFLTTKASFFFPPRLTSCRRSSLQIPFPDYPNVSQGGEGRWSTLKRLHAETLLPEGSFLACCKPSSLFFNHYDRSGMAVPWISSVEAFQQSTFGPNVCPSTCNAEAEYILSCILVVLFFFFKEGILF